MADPVDVYVQIAGRDLLAGQLWSHRRRQSESATFRYASDYLASADAYELDPGLPLIEGAQQTRQDQALFGAFSDCSPDRWGQRLVDRAERRGVGERGGTRRSFGAMDYLLRVRDDLRQGALRFRHPDSSEFLGRKLRASRRSSNSAHCSAPPTAWSATARTPPSSLCCSVGF